MNFRARPREHRLGEARVKLRVQHAPNLVIVIVIIEELASFSLFNDTEMINLRIDHVEDWPASFAHSYKIGILCLTFAEDQETLAFEPGAGITALEK